MKKLPSVSVVIPSYNYGRFISAAIDSALTQTHAPLEVIVVDDGSTDETFDVLKSYECSVQCIRQKNCGPSAARNAGIRVARGEWIAFLDADDIWFPNKLELQMECAVANPQVCIIGAFGDSVGRNLPENLTTLLTTNDFLTGLPFGTSSVVVRRDRVLEAGLFNENRRYVEDRELWLKLSMLGAGARVNTPLWHYRLHPNQCNSNSKRMAQNYREVLDEFFATHPEQIHQRQVAYAYYHYDSAMSFHLGGQNVSALKHLMASFFCQLMPVRRGNSEVRFIRWSLLLKILFGQTLFTTAMRLRRKLISGQALPAATAHRNAASSARV